jgi:hypothetical protein
VANIFSGGGRKLDLSNGGTEAFVEVLMLAVSGLASEAWHLRFAALLILQDQNVMGRGAVGFHLEEVDWGAIESARAVQGLRTTRHGSRSERTSLERVGLPPVPRA